MRVLIVTVQVPFVQGGAEILANNLNKSIREAGHESEIVSIPFKWYPPEKIVDHILSCRLLDFTEVNGQPVDKVIGLKFPAYLVPHKNKTIWLVHQHRTAYELWDSEFSDLIHFPNGREVRDIIRNADTQLLKEAKSIYTISKNVSNRLKKHNKIDSIPLYPPLEDVSSFYCNEPENFVFFPSRLTTIKRQELAIEAMKHVKSDIKLLIAGKPDDVNYEIHLKKIIEENNLSSKVKLLGNITEQQKLDYYSKALGVVYPPLDEDYGYVTLEALYSGKPVITTNDSGGPMEFIQNQYTGYVSNATSQGLAESIDLLCSNKEKAKKMGLSGREFIHAQNISWENVVKELLK